ncbi:MAG: zinc ABC transporter substrate-binding protein, partial [Alphaproteobacteria bacterium]|nr:zinc ABC transporter substrate-binding protein [Alphaproteobacteria bacterium]
GLGLEGWMERLAQSAAYKGAVVVASSGIQPQTMEEEEEGKKAPKRVIDPHAWQDLRNALVYADNIADGLAKADPAGAPAYKANAAAYKKQLIELDAWVRAEIGAVPKPKRKVITSHDAFGYFGSAYGVTFLAPVGISTDAEPSAKEVASLIRQIRKEKTKALFVENITNRKMIEQIGKETGVKLGGALFSDALSPPGGPGDSYIKMFRNNLPLLKAAMMQN